MSERQLNLLLHSLRSIQIECEKGKDYWSEQWQHEFYLTRKTEIEGFVDKYLETINLTDLINPGNTIKLTPQPNERDNHNH